MSNKLILETREVQFSPLGPASRHATARVEIATDMDNIGPFVVVTARWQGLEEAETLSNWGLRAAAREGNVLEAIKEKGMVDRVVEGLAHRIRELRDAIHALEPDAIARG